MVQRPGRSIAAVVAAVCLTAASSACGRTQQSAARVALLPSAVAKGRTWAWTSACRVGPQGATGCDASGPDLGVAQLAGNEWNLGRAATGDRVGEHGRHRVRRPAGHGRSRQRASVHGRDVHRVAGQHLGARLPERPVRHRPVPRRDVAAAVTRSCSCPMQVGSIPSDLIGSTTYDVRGTHVTYDVAYDLWLNASDTKTPCQTDGTLEVMVWTDYDAQALLPDALKVGTPRFRSPSNGAVDPGNQAWSVYVNNVYRSGHTVPWGGTVWLVLDPARTRQARARSPSTSARRSTRSARCSSSNYGWSNFSSNYWLDTIAFGMEFGPENADPYGSGPTDVLAESHVVLPRGRDDGRRGRVLTCCLRSARRGAVGPAAPVAADRWPAP